MAPTAASIQVAHDVLFELASKPGLTAAANARFVKADKTLHALGAKCSKGLPRHLTPKPVPLLAASPVSPVATVARAISIKPSPAATRLAVPAHSLSMVYGAPSVTNVVVTPTVDGATVEWNVSPASYGRLEFGATTGYGTLTAPQVSPLGYHLQTITGMPDGTVVHFRIWTDAANANAGIDRTFTTVADVAPVTEYPAITTLAYSAAPADAAPGYLTPITESAWGNEVMRATNIADQRHRYSSKAIWNADQSLAIMDMPPESATSQRAVVDGTTMEVLAPVNDTMGYFTWCNTLPNRNVAWAYSGLTIRKLAVTAAGVSLIQSWTLTALSGTYSAISLGGGQGSISDDDKYLAFMYKKTNNDHGVMVVDVSGSTPVVIAERFVLNSTASVGSSVVNNVGMSATGTYVVAGMGTAGSGVHQGTHIYPRNLTSDRLATTSSVHWDAGRLGDGLTDVLVICSQGATAKELGMYRMSDGAYTTLIPNWPGGHISTRNTQRPGWCYPSTYTAINGGTTYPGLGAVFALNLDVPSQVQMFFHVHGRTTADIAYDDYVTQPHSCPSPDGKRVVTATRWGGAAVYAFIGGVSATAPWAPVTPPPGPLRFVPMNSDAMPSYLGVITDSTWRTRIRRITDVAGRRNRYGYDQSWSKDGDYLYLPSAINTASRRMLDGQTYADLYGPVASAASQMIWRNTTNHGIGYNQSGLLIYDFDPAANTTTQIATFAATGGSRRADQPADWTFIKMGGAWVLTKDDHLTGFWAQRADGTYDAVAYDPVDDRIEAFLNLGSTEPTAVVPSLGGGFMVVDRGPSGSGTRGVYTMTARVGTTPGTFTHVRDMGYPGHGLPVQNKALQDMWVNCNDEGRVYLLSTGASTQLLAANSGPTKGHAGYAIDRPGYVYWSHDYVDAGHTTDVGYGQLLVTPLDEGPYPRVEVFGCHHNMVTTSAAASAGYEKRLFACPNRDGTLVLFGGDWHGEVSYSGSVYAFVAGMSV